MAFFIKFSQKIFLVLNTFFRIFAPKIYDYETKRNHFY